MFQKSFSSAQIGLPEGFNLDFRQAPTPTFHVVVSPVRRLYSAWELWFYNV